MFESTDPRRQQAVTNLVNAFKHLSMGATLEYSELERIAELDIVGAHRYVLAKARLIAERETGCYFETVRSVGIQRVPTEIMHETAYTGVRRIRRTANRSIARIDRARVNDLSLMARGTFAQTRIVYNFIKAQANVQAIKKAVTAFVVGATLPEEIKADIAKYPKRREG